MGPKIVPKRNAFIYNTSRPSQGTAVILNYTADRAGSEKDAKDICAVLEKLQFNVETWTNPTKGQLKESLKTVSEMDHTDSNFFVMVVMAHGDNNSIFINGQPFAHEKLWKHIVGNNCPSLIGKPKLVFIQSCRGKIHDLGVEVDAIPATINPVNINIPMYADLLVKYASHLEHVAYRDRENGSWFIQAMCDVLSEDIRGTELLSLLPKESHRVAYDYSNRVDAVCPGEQIPVNTSMLTRQLYFVDTKEPSSNAQASPSRGQRMLRLNNYVVLITILANLVQLIDGSSQSILMVLRHTEVTLICHHPSPNYSEQEVTWFFSPIDESTFKSVSDESRFKLNAENKSLLIRNVTIADAGMFFCCFDGPCMDTFLVVLEFENVLSFSQDMRDASGEIIISSKGDFSITAHHESVVKVEIVKEPNIPICSHFTGNIMCYKRSRLNSTSYYIKNANLQNSGRFFIQSAFNNLKGSYLLSILIHGKPALNIDRVQTEDEISFICRGQAYPPPVFEFRFIPADTVYTQTGSVSSILLQSLVTSQNSIDFIATSKITQSLSGPGTVECEASNTEGVSYAVAALYSFHPNSAISSSSSSTTTTTTTNTTTTTTTTTTNTTTTSKNSTQLDLLQFIIILPIQTTNNHPTVYLQCKAYFYEFSNSFIFQYKGINFFTNGTRQDDDWVANYTITETGDLVICNAQFNNGSKISKEISLTDFKLNYTIENEAVLEKSLSYVGIFIDSGTLILMLLFCIILFRKICSKSAMPSSSETDTAGIELLNEINQFNQSIIDLSMKVS